MRRLLCGALVLVVAVLAWAAPGGEPLAQRWSLRVDGRAQTELLAALGRNPAGYAIVTGDLGAAFTVSLRVDRQPLRTVFDCAAAVLCARWQQVGQTIVFTPRPELAELGSRNVHGLRQALLLRGLVEARGAPGLPPLSSGLAVPRARLTPLQRNLLANWESYGGAGPSRDAPWVAVGYGLAARAVLRGDPLGNWQELAATGPVRAAEVAR